MSNETTKDQVLTQTDRTHQPQVRRGQWKEPALHVLFFVGLMLVWHLSVEGFGVPRYILPSPIDIVERVIQDISDASFYVHVKVTLTEILVGFGIAAVAGTALGFAVVSIPILERLLTPYIVAFQTMPKVAIAPLAVIWLGYGMTAKIVLSALIAFFPVFVNVVTGFKSIEPDQILLMRSIGASPIQTFFKVRIFAVLPYLMAGLDIALIFSVIGAVIVEFIGSADGLGSLIIQRQANVDVPGTMSILIVLSALGIAFHAILMAASRKLTSWADQRATIAP